MLTLHFYFLHYQFSDWNNNRGKLKKPTRKETGNPTIRKKHSLILIAIRFEIFVFQQV